MEEYVDLSLALQALDDRLQEQVGGWMGGGRWVGAWVGDMRCMCGCVVGGWVLSFGWCMGGGRHLSHSLRLSPSCSSSAFPFSPRSLQEGPLLSPLPKAAASQGGSSALRSRPAPRRACAAPLPPAAGLRLLSAPASRKEAKRGRQASNRLTHRLL